jgi:hypothetical protein
MKSMQLLLCYFFFRKIENNDMASLRLFGNYQINAIRSLKSVWWYVPRHLLVARVILKPIFALCQQRALEL